MSESESIDGKILNYLLESPDAGDTLEGIAGWWLEREKVDYVVKQVDDALKSLLKGGLIEKIPTGEDKSIYRISKSIKRDI